MLIWLHYRLNKKVCAVVSEEKAMESNNSETDVFKLTYLEVRFEFLDIGSLYLSGWLMEVCGLDQGNSWIWEVGGVKILVDPILVGNLDFGIPWLYDAAKKFIKNFKVLTFGIYVW